MASASGVGFWGLLGARRRDFRSDTRELDRMHSVPALVHGWHVASLSHCKPESLSQLETQANGRTLSFRLRHLWQLLRRILPLCMDDGLGLNNRICTATVRVAGGEVDVKARVPVKMPSYVFDVT